MPFFNKIWKFIDSPSSLKKLRRKSNSHQISPELTSHQPRIATIEESITFSNSDDHSDDNTDACNDQSLQFIVNEHNQVVVGTQGSKVMRTVSVSRSGRYKTKSRRRSALQINFADSQANRTAARVNFTEGHDSSDVSSDQEQLSQQDTSYETDKELTEIEINFQNLAQIATFSSSSDNDSQNSN